jgi:hypothetical protein
MAELRIIPADRGRARRAFVGFPYQLHRREPMWVPQLRSDERDILAPSHPFFAHADASLFLAVRGGQTVGRVAAIRDRNSEVGSFGFFECADDPAAASALLEAARGWLAGCGAAGMRGPMNPSMNYTCGVLVEGFDDPPYAGMPYNPRYYDGLLRGAGLVQARELLALRWSRADLRSPKARRFLKLGARSGVRLRPLDPRRFDEEASLIWDLYSRCWPRTWGFAQCSLDEFRWIGRRFLRVCEGRLIQFCEVEGRPAGLIVILPDVNQALKRARGRLLPFGWWRLARAGVTATRARIVLLGVLPEFQGAGLPLAFLQLADLPGVGQYAALEASWVLEDNLPALRGAMHLGATVYKRYRMYDWPG